MITIDEFLTAADSVKPDKGGTTEPVAMAITNADVAFGIFREPEMPCGIGLMVLRGEWTEGERPANWSCVHCVSAEHARALAKTFGRVGPKGLTLAEASRELDRLAAISARERRRRMH